MLVLSRQRDETIMIGDDIEITVVDIRGDKVRLGISAPTRIAVHRKEVYESIKRENEQAARLASGDVSGIAAGGPALSPGPQRSRTSRLVSGSPGGLSVGAAIPISSAKPAAPEPPAARRASAASRG